MLGAQLCLTSVVRLWRVMALCITFRMEETAETSSNVPGEGRVNGVCGGWWRCASHSWWRRRLRRPPTCLGTSRKGTLQKNIQCPCHYLNWGHKHFFLIVFNAERLATLSIMGDQLRAPHESVRTLWNFPNFASIIYLSEWRLQIHRDGCHNWRLVLTSGP